MAQQQHQQQAVALQQRVDTLMQQLAMVAVKLQAREAQARKYKDAAKELKAGLRKNLNPESRLN